MHISGRRPNSRLAMHIGRITRMVGWRSDDAAGRTIAW
jgi:hypothetical protein